MNAISCQRIVLKDGETMDVELPGIAASRMYALFYVVACEYPLRPIVYGDVQKLEMVTVLLEGMKLNMALGLVLMAIMIILF